MRSLTKHFSIRLYLTHFCKKIYCPTDVRKAGTWFTVIKTSKAKNGKRLLAQKEQSSSGSIKKAAPLLGRLSRMTGSRILGSLN